ncbi:protein aardvark [Anaeramoeba ignava]|uniref:Protein aardvark n=1 Tax=Anaeramoeba ignava TaxID=1746090 RepID=A0A9Q0LTR2_ANAIG|nr:protein aardvark [Anaeramoeba ignava]
MIPRKKKEKNPFLNVEQIIETLIRCDLILPIQFNCISSITLLAKKGKEFQEQIRFNKGIELILERIRGYIKNLKLQTKSLKALVYIIMDNYENIQYIINLEGFSSVWEFTQNNLTDSKIQLWGLFFIYHISFFRDYVDMLINDKIINYILNSLENFQDNENILSISICCLSNITFKNSEIQSKIYQFSGIEKIWKAMKKFEQNNQLQIGSALCLSNLSENKESKQKILLMNGMQHFIHLIKTFNKNQNLVRFSFQTISNLLYQNQDYNSVIENDLIPLINLIWKDAEKINTVASKLCLVVAQIAKNEQMRAAIGKSKIKKIISIGTRFRANLEIQQNCFLALSNLACDMPENQLEILKNGGIELIIARMKNFQEIQEIQENCLLCFINISEQENWKPEIINIVDFELLKNLMISFSDSENFFGKYLLLFSNLSLSPEMMKKIFEFGLVDTIVAIHQEKFISNINIWLKFTSFICVVASPFQSYLCSNLQIHNMILKGMSQFSENEELQLKCCVLFQIFIPYINEEMIQLISQAIQKFPNNHILIWIGLEVILNFLRKTQGEKLDLFEEKIHSILQNINESCFNIQEIMKLSKEIELEIVKWKKN